MNKLDLTAEQWHTIDTIVAPYRNSSLYLDHEPPIKRAVTLTLTSA